MHSTKWLPNTKFSSQTRSKSFDNALSFTEMSGGVLDKHKKQYQNVYYKGALIGLALDLRLRQLSKGKYGTQNLLSDLSKKYGTDRSFKDEALFDEIARLSYPEIRTFFKQYVEGAAPLPFRELFSSIGVHFDPKAKKKEVQYALGIQFKAEKETGYLVMDSIYEPLDLTKRLGIKVGDRVRNMNGQEFNFSTYQSVFQGLKKLTAGDVLKLEVERPTTNGSEIVMLEAELEEVEVETITLAPDPKANESQLLLRNQWIGK